MTTPDPTPAWGSVLRLRVGMEQAHYAGDLVDGAFMLKLFGDVATELLIRHDGDAGLFRAYDSVEFTAPVRAGDYIEARGRITRVGNTSRAMEFEAVKVITLAGEGSADSAADVLHPPEVVCRATGTCVVPKTCCVASEYCQRCSVTGSAGTSGQVGARSGTGSRSGGGCSRLHPEMLTQTAAAINLACQRLMLCSLMPVAAPVCSRSRSAYVLAPVDLAPAALRESLVVDNMEHS